MSSLRSVDLSLIDEIMNGGTRGYVLDFSNRTFADFFVREMDVDIDASLYSEDGTSKGKRLQCFLKKVDDATAAKLLSVLWEHREAIRPQGQQEPYPRAAQQLASILARLRGSGLTSTRNVVPAPRVEAIEFDRFRARLLEIRDQSPHQRGYAFEGFLQDLFNAFGMSAREPFRNIGEQIDGSFELAGETYLVEAKWLNRKVGIAELGAFHSKLEQKAQWTRGAFISFQGFTDEGLNAFGRGRRIIGLDGRDLFVAMEQGMSLDRLIALKVRRASETGNVFVPIDQLI
ncbi:restriction endonuclease [Paracoccus nototheniae]|uniref:Restriction endonuclease n=2 Tax=root TaxID=1 RepID=A0ABW4DXD0_9RHOB|nr:restriction endonuclease [Paracoccus nototheniae]